MTFEPRELEKGWLQRCFMNAIKLSLRTPIAWICVYMLPLFLSEHVKKIPLLMLISGFVMMAGTVLAFKADTHFQEPLKKTISRLLSTGYIFLFAAIAVWGIMWISIRFSSGQLLIDVQDMPLFGSFSSGMGFMVISVTSIGAFAMILEMLMSLFLIFTIERPIRLYSFGMFSIHLSVEHEMGMLESGKLSRQGVFLNIDKFFPIVIMFGLVIVFAPFIGILVPFMYCLYIEIYWGAGLVEQKKNFRKSYTSAQWLYIRMSMSHRWWK